MTRRNTIVTNALAAAIILLLTVVAARAAEAETPSSAGRAAAELSEAQGRIAAAPTVEEAKALAFEQTLLAEAALDAAEWAAPRADVNAARAKLAVFTGSIDEARTPAEVASRFDGMAELASAPGMGVLYGDLEAGSAEVEVGAHACHYTTGEIIVIVIGFFLFVIPGIIFLFLLC